MTQITYTYITLLMGSAHSTSSSTSLFLFPLLHPFIFITFILFTLISAYFLLVLQPSPPPIFHFLLYVPYNLHYPFLQPLNLYCPSSTQQYRTLQWQSTKHLWQQVHLELNLTLLVLLYTGNSISLTHMHRLMWRNVHFGEGSGIQLTN